MAEPAVRVEEREAAAREIVAAQRIQDDFRDRVAAIGRDLTPQTLTVLADRGPSDAAERPDYRSLSREGIQTVLEVRLESVTLEGGEMPIDPPLWLVMIVNTRLVRTDDNAELYANSLTYTGQKGRTLAEWVGGSEVFRDELDRTYAILAEKIVEEVFLILPLPGCSKCLVVGLRPLYPEIEPSSPEVDEGTALQYWDFPLVDSLQPTLRWEAFPQSADFEGDREGWLSRIRNVTYDMRIWAFKTGSLPFQWYPGELIYSRSGLPAPTHRIELRLDPDIRYLWSVRARFDLDKQQRVTEWGVLLKSHGREYDPRTAHIPALNYYRFWTPSDEH